MPRQAFTKEGKRIIGTYEHLDGMAEITGFEDDGEPIYTGSTDVWWDNQHTVTVAGSGERIFIDEDLNTVGENSVEWREVDDADDEEEGESLDEWRGEVAMNLRNRGRDELADAFGALADCEVVDYRDDSMYEVEIAADMFIAEMDEEED